MKTHNKITVRSPTWMKTNKPNNSGARDVIGWVGRVLAQRAQSPEFDPQGGINQAWGLRILTQHHRDEGWEIQSPSSTTSWGWGQPGLQETERKKRVKKQIKRSWTKKKKKKFQIGKAHDVPGRIKRKKPTDHILVKFLNPRTRKEMLKASRQM